MDIYIYHISKEEREGERHIHRRLGGLNRQVPQPGNRFVSFVRACGRGEAKLRERDVSPVARGR